MLDCGRIIIYMNARVKFIAMNAGKTEYYISLLVQPENRSIRISGIPGNGRNSILVPTAMEDSLYLIQRICFLSL